jgi:repressor LexA
MKSLTEQQQRILNYVIERQQENGSSPTVREITSHFGYKSPNNVQQHLQLIEQKGYIERLPGKSRGIVVRDAAQYEEKSTINVPLLGTIAAGTPLTAVENVDGRVAVDRDLFREDSLFALRVKGDSMQDMGILSGDLAIVQSRPTVENGEVAAVIIDGEATLKRVYRKADQIVLHAENKEFDDIVVTSDQDVQIAGKMVGVVRKC